MIDFSDNFIAATTLRQFEIIQVFFKIILYSKLLIFIKYAVARNIGWNENGRL